jgi:hypothetical protein
MRPFLIVFLTSCPLLLVSAGRLQSTCAPSIGSIVARYQANSDPLRGGPTLGFITATKTEVSKTSQTVVQAIELRGGSATSVLSSFSNYIGSSKTRCWIVLLFAILTDSFSTSVMKMARDESSLSKLLVAYCGYFLR